MEIRIMLKKHFSKKITLEKEGWSFTKDMLKQAVPQSWNAWLHHVIDDVPAINKNKPEWIKNHTPNLTGTSFAYEYKKNRRKREFVLVMVT